MKAKFLMIATAVTVLTACSNDENVVNDGPVEAKVTAGLGTETRAVNDDPSTWKASDEIGVMVTSVTGTPTGVTSLMVNRYKNVKYTTTNGGTTATFAAAAGEGIFFQDATETVTFAAYYPYQTTTDASTLPGTSGVISVATQSKNTTADQASIDFLFASGATATKTTHTVNFSGTENQFKHQMAQLKLVIVGSTADGFTADEAKAVCTTATTGAYKLGGLIHTGTFTVATTGGTAAVTTGTTPVTDWDITGCVHTDVVNSYTRTYTLILLPQDLSSSALSLEATVGGQTYKNSTDIKPNLQAGKSYTYTITLKKTGLTVSGCTIAVWDTGSTGNGDAVM